MSISTVLVVDDSMTERTHLGQILSESGIRVLSAASGTEALDIAKEKRPDLIFLDIMMDTMDGFQTCRKLTNGPETKAIPVVMVSSKANKADKVWASEQGARGYVTKPYTAADIRAELARFG